MRGSAAIVARPEWLPKGYGYCPVHVHSWPMVVGSSCPRCAAKEPAAVAPTVATKARGRSTYRAQRTTCELGHSHPSKVEARVCHAVYRDHGMNALIFRNVRLPLWALPPTDNGIPHYCNVDFVLYAKEKGGIVAMIDAKSGKRSRDWERGRAAVEATYGVKVEERS